MRLATELSSEKVCLVDNQNRPIGDCLKSEVHGYRTPLHRAFSVFLFDERDRVLLQQRSWGKRTWPGIWSNSCCGHPTPFESDEQAARRRLREELGVSGGDLHEALPHFRYRSRYMGIEENEICPVFTGRLQGIGDWNRREIEAVAWMEWKEFLDLMEGPPSGTWGTFSPWSRREARLLARDNDYRRRKIMNLRIFKPID